MVARCYLLADTGRRSVGRGEQEAGGGGIMSGVSGESGWGGGVFAGCCR